MRLTTQWMDREYAFSAQLLVVDLLRSVYSSTTTCMALTAVTPWLCLPNISALRNKCGKKLGYRAHRGLEPLSLCPFQLDRLLRYMGLLKNCTNCEKLFFYSSTSMLFKWNTYEYSLVIPQWFAFKIGWILWPCDLSQNEHCDSYTVWKKILFQ